MKSSYFYPPLATIFLLTLVIAFFVFHGNQSPNSLKSSLLVNLLASGVTVLCTALLIDRSIRAEKKRDTRPGLNFVNETLREEVEWFFRKVGYIKTALDTNTALGHGLNEGGKPRDLVKEYLYGVDTAERMSTKTFAGQTKYALGWILEPAERLVETLEEVIGNCNYVLSSSDLTKLYKIKKELLSTITQIKQFMNKDLEEFAEGYYSPDEGYVSNRDYAGDRLSSMKAYYVNRTINLALEIEKLKLKLPLK